MVHGLWDCLHFLSEFKWTDQGGVVKRIGVFEHTEISFVQYLKELLDERGIECIVRNDNVAIAGLMERTAQVVSPELWVMDDSRVPEAIRLVGAASPS